MTKRRTMYEKQKDNPIVVNELSRDGAKGVERDGRYTLVTELREQ